MWTSSPAICGSSGVQAGALHSGKSQPQRTHTLARFKDGGITVLVATNVAARGIHVEHLDLVVNVDPPSDPKDYLHRGGRTARAGESGSVVTLVTPDQRRDVNRMMSDAGIRPTVTQVRSGEERLTSITGAKRPPVQDKAKTGNAAFRGIGTRTGRRPKESRKAAEARTMAEARRPPECARATDGRYRSTIRWCLEPGREFLKMGGEHLVDAPNSHHSPERETRNP